MFGWFESYSPGVVTTVNVVNRQVPFALPTLVLLAFPCDRNVETVIVGITALVTVTVVNGVC